MTKHDCQINCIPFTMGSKLGKIFSIHMYEMFEINKNLSPERKFAKNILLKSYVVDIEIRIRLQKFLHLVQYVTLRSNIFRA